MPPDESLGTVWLGVSSSLVVLLIITTVLRLWTRLGRRNVGLDDYTIAVSAVTATTRYAFGVMQLRYGNGRHRFYLSDYNYMMLNMYGWWGQLFHFTSMAFLKVSLCLLAIRIQSSRTLKVLLYTVMAGSLVINFAVVAILLAECRPAGFWRNDAQCWPNTFRIYAIWISIAYSVLSDLLCSLLPLMVVWKIKIPVQKKAMVTSLMSLGLVATAFGIVRAKSLSVSESDLSCKFMAPSIPMALAHVRLKWDETGDFCITAIWSNLELFLGITTANLALSRAIYLYFLPPNAGAISTKRWDPSSHGYIHNELRSDCFEGPTTMVSSSRQQHSKTRILERDVSQTKTEFWWREDANRRGLHE
ncbi:integral membrane protein [Colletotrichum tofieldiae]|uniref:Integral membrane protein n=1 Tax=Colletotrichum tofieldiae TaxID=708197 RepID=A0A161VIZ5_9PEZI|nr:integral membrane protein [Colletotrichum tofieldiae]